MNYGYNASSFAWNEKRKLVLADKLEKLIGKFGTAPYIEIDGLYDGVRIRKITDLSDDQVAELTEKADRIYDEVMGCVTGASK